MKDSKKIKWKLAWTSLLFATMLGIGYITVWIAMNMNQTLPILIIIGASGPVWALITIWYICFRMDYFKLWKDLKANREHLKRNEILLQNCEYQELRNKYPLSILRHEQHCEHRKISPERTISLALAVSHEEWAEREEFRRQVREERLSNNSQL